MKLHFRSVLCLCLAATVASAAPDKNDYAQGIRVDSLSDRPLIELLLPDSVYQSITRADLGDVRVFNADGSPVAHGFCAAPQAEAPVITKESLPVFELQAGPKGETVGDGAKVEVQTAGGTQIHVQEGQSTIAAPAGPETSGHVIDARGVLMLRNPGSGTDALRSIQFDWQSPDGASEAHVRIESSEDLDRWQTVVGASTLLRVRHGTQELQRQTIPLPLRQYQYLRATRVDGGPPLQIAGVIAERVAIPQAIEPQWFAANALASTDPAMLMFDTARRAPVTYARLLLPQDNTSLRVTLSSRDDDKAAWSERWSGEVYSIVNGGERRSSAPAEFRATTDRYWRAQFAGQAEVPAQPPTLDLGYRPTRLRFLAQGAGPFTLAYGSRRAEPSPTQPCGNLLADVGARDIKDLIGDAALQPAQVLGGEAAFKPLPRKTPLRLFILWGVLILGVALLIGMAMSLLKRVNVQ